MKSPGGLINFKHFKDVAYKKGGLTNFYKIFKLLTKYLLFENREKHSFCLVYASLVDSRRNKIEK